MAYTIPMKNDIMSDIGARIRQLRVKNGLTLEEAAELAGVHPNYLGDAERGKKNFSITTLEKLAKVLGVPVAAMLSGRKEPSSAKAAPVDRLVSLFRNASPEEQNFIIQTAKFIIRNKKQTAK